MASATGYHGGQHVELLSAQGASPLAQWRVVAPSKNLLKLYDPGVKGYCYCTAAKASSKLQIPKNDKDSLGLPHSWLVLQALLQQGQPLTVELAVQDTSRIKRRLVLSSSFTTLKATPLHGQVPLVVARGVWLNLVIPLADLTAALFKGASFQTLDCLTVSGSFKLRRIFTLREQPNSITQERQQQDDTSCAISLPKSLQLPTELDVITQVVDPKVLAGVLPVTAKANADSRPSVDGRSVQTTQVITSRQTADAAVCSTALVSRRTLFCNSPEPVSPVPLFKEQPTELSNTVDNWTITSVPGNAKYASIPDSVPDNPSNAQCYTQAGPMAASSICTAVTVGPQAVPKSFAAGTTARHMLLNSYASTACTAGRPSYVGSELSRPVTDGSVSICSSRQGLGSPMACRRAVSAHVALRSMFHDKNNMQTPLNASRAPMLLPPDGAGMLDSNNGHDVKHKCLQNNMEASGEAAARQSPTANKKTTRLLRGQQTMQNFNSPQGEEPEANNMCFDARGCTASVAMGPQPGVLSLLDFPPVSPNNRYAQRSTPGNALPTTMDTIEEAEDVQGAAGLQGAVLTKPDKRAQGARTATGSPNRARRPPLTPASPQPTSQRETGSKRTSPTRQRDSRVSNQFSQWPQGNSTDLFGLLQVRGGLEVSTDSWLPAAAVEDVRDSFKFVKGSVSSPGTQRRTQLSAHRVNQPCLEAVTSEREGLQWPSTEREDSHLSSKNIAWPMEASPSATSATKSRDHDKTSAIRSSHSLPCLPSLIATTSTPQAAIAARERYSRVPSFSDARNQTQVSHTPSTRESMNGHATPSISASQLSSSLSLEIISNKVQASESPSQPQPPTQTGLHMSMLNHMVLNSDDGCLKHGCELSDTEGKTFVPSCGVPVPKVEAAEAQTAPPSRNKRQTCRSPSPGLPPKSYIPTAQPKANPGTQGPAKKVSGTGNSVKEARQATASSPLRARQGASSPPDQAGLLTQTKAGRTSTRPSRDIANKQACSPAAQHQNADGSGPTTCISMPAAEKSKVNACRPPAILTRGKIETAAKQRKTVPGSQQPAASMSTIIKKPVAEKASSHSKLPGGPALCSQVHLRSVAHSIASSVCEVDESVHLQKGIWGGFGVDEDDVLSSHHLRASMCSFVETHPTNKAAILPDKVSNNAAHIHSLGKNLVGAQDAVDHTSMAAGPQHGSTGRGIHIAAAKSCIVPVETPDSVLHANPVNGSAGLQVNGLGGPVWSSTAPSIKNKPSYIDDVLDDVAFRGGQLTLDAEGKGMVGLIAAVGIASNKQTSAIYQPDMKTGNGHDILSFGMTIRTGKQQDTDKGRLSPQLLTALQREVGSTHSPVAVGGPLNPYSFDDDNVINACTGSLQRGIASTGIDCDWAHVEQLMVPSVDMNAAGRLFTPPVHLPSRQVCTQPTRKSRSSLLQPQSSDFPQDSRSATDQPQPSCKQDEARLTDHSTAIDRSSFSSSKVANGTRRLQQTEALKQQPTHPPTAWTVQPKEHMLDLVYDPVLNCYYDPVSGMYYALRM